MEGAANSEYHQRPTRVELVPQVFLQSPTDEFLSASFDKDAKRVITGNRNGKVSLWSVSTGKILQEFSINGEVWLARISFDGEYVLCVTTFGNLHVWSTRSNELVLSLHEGEGADAVFLPDTNHLVFGGVKSPIRVWRLDKPKEVATIGSGNHGGEFKSSNLSSRQALAFTQEYSGKSRVFDLARHQWLNCVCELPESTGSFSHDGTKLVTTSSERPLEIWDVETGEVTGAIPNYKEPRFWLSSCTVMYGDLLGVFSCATSLRFFSIGTTEPIAHTCHVDIGYSFEGEFSADGSLLLLASDPWLRDVDGTTVWQVKT